MPDPAALPRPPDVLDLDLVVVGAGFAGLYALWSARQRGLRVQGVEKAPDVGGTWYWNSYPGARCDVASYSYQYFFRDDVVRDWDWSDVNAPQPEIQRYLRFVAERCGVLPSIAFDTVVESAHWLADRRRWRVTTSRGQTLETRYLMLAIGALSNPKAPDIPGVDDFAGDRAFTCLWPKDRDVALRDRRVGVIGTGSSGVQAVPEIAKVAREVVVFQRTANYVVPTEAGPMDPGVVGPLRDDPAAARVALRQTYAGHQVVQMGEQRYGDLDEAGRERALQAAWDGRYIALAFRDAHLPEANAAISDFIRRRMQAQVNDPWTANQLVPWDHPYGGKRPCRSDAYLPAFNLPHVRLVSLRETPITRIVADGVQTSREHIPLDTLVFATGFDAISGAVFAIDIRGEDGLSMRDAWADGPINYLGTMVRGFPNLFLPSSAMSPSVLSNMATLAEQQVDFILQTIEWLDAHGRPALQPLAASQQAWREQTLHYAQRRPGALTTNSWYTGANIPGKPRVFMVYCGGFKRYDDLCLGELRDGFPGYELSA